MDSKTRINEGPAEVPVNWAELPCHKFTPFEGIPKKLCLMRQKEAADIGQPCRDCEYWAEDETSFRAIAERWAETAMEYRRRVHLARYALENLLQRRLALDERDHHLEEILDILNGRYAKCAQGSLPLPLGVPRAKASSAR